MNWAGVLAGVWMLVCIGVGFAWVIRVEYHLGARVWKAVLGLGILICLASLWAPSFWLSAGLGILGGSVVWGATELPPQEERVRRGLFPANPRRSERERVSDYGNPPGGVEP